MNLRTVFTVLVCLMGVGDALGVDNTFIPNDGDWSDPNNWSELHVPTASENAVIPADKTCHMDVANAVADSFFLGNGADLLIEPGNKLTIDGSSSAVSGVATHNISTGTIVLEGSGSQLEFTTVHHTITGSGSIQGADNAALLTMATASKTLTNSITTGGIVGHLEISGAGNFTNNGSVQALQDPGVSGEELVIKVGGTVDDSAGVARWKIPGSQPNARLVFHADIGTLASMEGEFCILSGTIVINKALTTTGRLDMVAGLLEVQQTTTMGNNSAPANPLEMNAGQIKVDAGKTFTHH